MGLRGQQVIAVLPEHVQRGRYQSIAALKQVFAEDATCCRPLLKPATATTATMSINQFPIPSGAPSPGVRVRINGIMQHGYFIDCPINNPGLDTHDERPTFPVFTDQLCHVNGRQYAESQRIRQKCLLFGRIVNIVCLHRPFAPGFRSSAEHLTIDLLKLRGLAVEGSFMWTGNYRATERVVSQAKLSLLLACRSKQ